MMGGMGMMVPPGMVGFSAGVPGPDFQPDPDFLKKTKIAIEVMSRIIDSRLQEALGESYKSKGFFSKGCQGYWIPGQGVLFTLSVDFPLHRQNGEKKEEAEESHEKDEWDEILDKIEVKEASPQSNDRYDEGKVERLKTRILNVIAKYGKRFEGFNPNETITVVIEGASLTGPFDLSRMYWRTAPKGRGGAYGGFSTGGGYGTEIPSPGSKENEEVEQLKKELEQLKAQMKADSKDKKSEEERQKEEAIKLQEEARRKLQIDTLQLELARIRSSMDELKDRTDEESAAKMKELQKQQSNIELELKKIEVDKSEKELARIKEMPDEGIQKKSVDVIIEPKPGENKVVIENRIAKTQDAVNALKNLSTFQFDLTPGAPDNGQNTAMIIRICFSSIPEGAEGMEEIQDAVSIVTY